MLITNVTSNGLQITNDGSAAITLQYSPGNSGLVVDPSGALGVGSSPNYGTSGLALISNGPSSPPSWGVAGLSQAKASAFDLTFGWFK